MAQSTTATRAWTTEAWGGGGAVFSIILAAGKGTRMGATDRPKVCFELDGAPVIVRAIETYARCGVRHHVLVVGDRAEQVMATVAARCPGAIFAYQAEQKGTGHATRCGAAMLEAFEYQGDVLVTAGDKVLAEAAVARLLETFRATAADLCLLVGAKEDAPTAGRIIEDEAGRILGIVERSDAARAQLIGRWLAAVAAGPLAADRVRAELLAAFATERKARRALPALWERLADRPTLAAEDLRACLAPEDAVFTFLDPDGRPVQLSGGEIEARARRVNLSVYCFRMPALRYALAHLTAANAQGEEYLTDAVAILAGARPPDGRARFRLVAHGVAQRTDALAFNSLEELEAIRALGSYKSHPSSS